MLNEILHAAKETLQVPHVILHELRAILQTYKETLHEQYEILHSMYVMLQTALAILQAIKTNRK